MAEATPEVVAEEKEPVGSAAGAASAPGSAAKPRARKAKAASGEVSS
jgi:hypothetical protein